MSSSNLWIHLLRGVCGFALLAVALGIFGNLGWWALAPVAGALFFLRGCPMCWLVGLVMTIIDGRSTSCRI